MQNSQAPGGSRPGHGRRLSRLALLAVPLAGLALSLGPAVAGATAPAHPVVVKEGHNAKLGTILVTANGFTLYHFTRDRPNHPTCTGTCAALWPPLLLPQGAKSPAGGSGISGLGTVKVHGGRWQVTYHGTPLYRFAPDRRPGSAMGQGLEGLWFVVRPSHATASGGSHTSGTSGTSGGSGGSSGSGSYGY